MTDNMEGLVKLTGLWAVVMTVLLAPLTVWEVTQLRGRIVNLEVQEPAVVGPTGLEHFHDKEVEDQQALDRVCAILYNGFRIDLLRHEGLDELLAEMFEEICDMHVPTRSARGYF